MGRDICMICRKVLIEFELNHYRSNILTLSSNNILYNIYYCNSIIPIPIYIVKKIYYGSAVLKRILTVKFLIKNSFTEDIDIVYICLNHLTFMLCLR